MLSGRISAQQETREKKMAVKAQTCVIVAVAVAKSQQRAEVTALPYCLFCISKSAREEDAKYIQRACLLPGRASGCLSPAWQSDSVRRSRRNGPALPRLFMCNGMFRFTISKLCRLKLVCAIGKSHAITRLPLQTRCHVTLMRPPHHHHHALTVRVPSPVPLESPSFCAALISCAVLIPSSPLSSPLAQPTSPPSPSSFSRVRSIFSSA